jgi:hypothetical protein
VAFPLAGGQLPNLDAAGGRQLPERGLQRAGGQLGAGIATPHGRHPLLTGHRILTGE